MGSISVPRIRLARLLAPALAVACLVSCSGGDGPTGPGAEEPPPASLVDLIGPTVYRADGSQADINEVTSKALVGLYFSAAWCPSCAGFTPVLVRAYQELRQGGKSFEVVLVSLDNSASEMFAHMTERGMPWLALPFSRSKAESLAQRLDVRWIPTLVVLDAGGVVVSAAGREEVAARGAAAYDGWLAASQGR